MVKRSLEDRGRGINRSPGSSVARFQGSRGGSFRCLGGPENKRKLGDHYHPLHRREERPLKGEGKNLHRGRTWGVGTWSVERKVRLVQVMCPCKIDPSLEPRW